MSFPGIAAISSKVALRRAASFIIVTQAVSLVDAPRPHQGRGRSGMLDCHTTVFHINLLNIESSHHMGHWHCVSCFFVSLAYLLLEFIVPLKLWEYQCLGQCRS